MKNIGSIKGEMEPILVENENRFVLTVDHKDIDDFYQKHKAAFWTPQEIDLQQDLAHWSSELNDDEERNSSDDSREAEKEPDDNAPKGKRKREKKAKMTIKGA